MDAAQDTEHGGAPRSLSLCNGAALMKALVLSMLFPLMLLGCASSTPQPPGATPVSFTCDGGAALSITFDRDTAWLDGPDGKVRLASTPVASGFEYVGSDTRIRGKGHELTWTPPHGPAIACREAGAPAPSMPSPSAASALAGTT